jgi:tetratricopeptide (TPR) repeat protein
MFKKVLIVLLISISSYSYCQTESADGFYKQAIRSKREGNYQQAVDFLTDALRMSPSSAVYYSERAYIYFGLNKPKKAKQDYDKAISVEPESPIGYTQRAEYYNIIRLPDSALKDCEKAISLAKTNKEKGKVMIAKANAYKLNENLIEAISNYEGLKLDTLNKEGFKNYAAVLETNKNEKEAIEQLKKAISLDAFDIANYNNIGYLYIKIGMYQESLPFFDQALKFDSKEPYSLSNKGLALCKLENYDEALKCMNKSIANDPDNAFAYRNRALVHLGKKNNEAACRDLKKAIDLGYTVEYKDSDVSELISKYCFKNPNQNNANLK